MRMILTVDTPERDDLTCEGCERIVDNSTLRDCLETSLGAGVSIEVSVVKGIDTVFLRARDAGSVFAVFPALKATSGDPLDLVCFSSEGQHDSVSLAYCAKCDEIVNPAEYADLLTELQGISPYVPHVVRKDCISHR